MYRCGNCDWFAPRSKHSAKGKCICTDEDKPVTDKRCKENFKKKTYRKL